MLENAEMLQKIYWHNEKQTYFAKILIGIFLSVCATYGGGIILTKNVGSTKN